MIKVVLKVFSTLCVLLALVSFISLSDCQGLIEKNQCIDQFGKDYMIIKSFGLDAKKGSKKGEIEHSYHLSKGMNYVLIGVNNSMEWDRVEIKLYNKKRKLIATNYIKKKDEFHPLNYACTSSGIYYLRYKLKSQNASCGVGVLGIKK